MITIPVATNASDSSREALPAELPPPPLAIASHHETIFTTGSTLATTGRPAGLSEGDLLLAYMFIGDDSGHTVTGDGWTKLFEERQIGTSCNHRLFSRIAGPSEPETYSWSWAGTGDRSVIIWLVRITGADADLSVATQGGGDSNTYTVPSIAGQAGGLLINSWVTRRGQQTFTLSSPPNGYGFLVQGVAGENEAFAHTSAAIGFQALATTEATGPRVTTSSGTASRWLASSLLVKPLGEGRPPPPPPPRPSDILWRPSWGSLSYSHGTSDTVQVSSSQELQKALAEAPAGRNILVTPGHSHAGGTHTMSGGGSTGNPVVIRPRDGLGTVTFTDPVWTFTGSHVVLENMHFTGAAFMLNGTHLRITRNRFRTINKRTIQPHGFFLRIDHNDFSDMIDGPDRGAIFIASTWFRDNEVGKLLIDTNYLHSMFNKKSNNATEVMAFGTTSAAIGSPDRDVIVAHNLFQKHSQKPEGEHKGEGEILTLKIPHLFIVDNTFTEISMYISFRTTHSCKYWSNWHDGNVSPIIRINGDNHDVRGNHMVKGNMRVGSGNGTTQQQINALPTLTTLNAATSKGLFVGNTCAGGAQIRAGEFHRDPSVPATNNVFEANDNVVRSAKGTHQIGPDPSRTTTHDFTPGKRPGRPLTPSDVGMAAVDLLA
jgi:hypothetical protein